MKIVRIAFAACALISSGSVLARGAQEEHCRTDDHSFTVSQSDAAYRGVVDAVRRFSTTADKNQMVMPERFLVGDAEVVSYSYSVLKCSKGENLGAQQENDGLPSVGDINSFPGANSPVGTTMSISTCATGISTTIEYVKVESGWMVTKVTQQHVKMCQAGGF